VKKARYCLNLRWGAFLKKKYHEFAVGSYTLDIMLSIGGRKRNYLK